MRSRLRKTTQSLFLRRLSSRRRGEGGGLLFERGDTHELCWIEPLGCAISTTCDQLSSLLAQLWSWAPEGSSRHHWPGHWRRGTGGFWPSHTNWTLHEAPLGNGVSQGSVEKRKSGIEAPADGTISKKRINDDTYIVALPEGDLVELENSDMSVSSKKVRL